MEIYHWLSTIVMIMTIEWRDNKISNQIHCDSRITMEIYVVMYGEIIQFLITFIETVEDAFFTDGIKEDRTVLLIFWRMEYIKGKKKKNYVPIMSKTISRTH